MERQAYRIITHLHSAASNGPASSLYPYVQAGIDELVGEEKGKTVKWRESLITAEHLIAILEQRYFELDLLCLTDHINGSSYKLSEESLRIARAYDNLILGAELATVSYSERKGCYLPSPEVLIYGPPHKRVDRKGRGHWGITQSDLDEIYLTCVPPNERQAEINGVMEYLEEKGFAWALAHPLDAHSLDMNELLPLLLKANSLEVLNGGFPATSFEMLADFVELHNSYVAGDRSRLPHFRMLPERNERLLNYYSGAQLKRIIPLGGSDAHLNNFDRVVTWLYADKTEGEESVAGLFLSGLCGDESRRPEFIPMGKPMNRLNGYVEAGYITLTNVLENKIILKKTPVAKVAGVSGKIILERFSTFYGDQRALLEEMSSLNIPRFHRQDR